MSSELQAKVKKHWDNPSVESMYDKILIQKEINLIKSFIPENTKILDAGCGEGEGTLQYASIQGVKIDAVDYSETRLQKARGNCNNVENIAFMKIDFLRDYELDSDYDVIISQRFLINILDWEKQKKIILDLISHLKNDGILILFEGSQDGVNRLNEFRGLFNLKPIEIKWHNRFFKDIELETFLKENNLKIIKKDSLSTFYFLTRGIKPIFEKDLNWNSQFNSVSATKQVEDILALDDRFSRTKLWLILKK
ncbi:MAG: class I SAM-dependent methyltransferase [Bacteroidales bacterium]|nr:class I SAM-dependent methyltransferase [Bacteroidales bacterium]